MILFTGLMILCGICAFFPKRVVAVAIIFAITDAMTMIIRTYIISSSSSLVLPVKTDSSSIAIGSPNDPEES